MGSIGTLWVNLSADNKKFRRAIDQTMRDLRRSGAQMKRVGRDLTTGLSLPIVGIGAAAIKMSTDFNKSMANVATLIPGNIGRINELKKNVQSLAVETGKSTSDLAEGLYQVVSAFGDSADAAKQLEITTKAAVAGVATTTDSLNLLSAVTKGYGDTSIEAMQKAADLAFMTVKLGQTTFPELAESIGRVVPLAATLGVKQEELFAGFSTLTGVTGDANQVSTQLAAILRALIKPTEGMKEAITSLGYSSAQSLLGDKGMVGALNALTSVTDGTQEGVAKLFGRAEALTSVFALTGSQAETFAAKLDLISQSGGAATEAYREQTEGVNALGHRFNQLKQSLVTTAQTLGDALAPALIQILELSKPLIDAIAKLAEWFANTHPTLQKVIVGFLALVAAVGPAFMAIGQAKLVLAAIIPILKGLPPLIIGIKAALAALGWAGSGVLGLVLLAITGVVLAWKNWDKISAFIKKIYTAAKEWLEEKLLAIFDKIKDGIEKVKGFFKGLWQDVVGGSYIPDLVRGIGEWIDKLDDNMVRPVRRFTDAVASYFADMAIGIKTSFTDMVNSILRDLLRMGIRNLLTDVIASFPRGASISEGREAPIGGGAIGNAFAGGGTAKIIVNNYSGSPVDVKRKPSASGEQIEITIGAMREAIMGGALDGAAGFAWGVSRVPVGR